MRNELDPEADRPLIDIDVSDILFLIRNNLKLLVILPIVFAVIGFIAHSAINPMYFAKSTFYIRPDFDQYLSVDKPASRGEDIDSLQSIADSMVSDSVILAMIDRLKLKEEPDFLPKTKDIHLLSDFEILEEVEGRYTTEMKPATRLVELKVKSHSKERTVLINKEIKKLFLEHLSQERTMQEQAIREVLERQSKKALDRSLESEEELRVFRIANPDLLVEQDSAIFNQRLAELSTSLNQAKSNSYRLAGIIKAIKDVDPETTPQKIFQLFRFRQNDHIDNLLTLQAEAESNFANIQNTFTERTTQYRAAEERLNSVRRNVIANARRMRDGADSEYQAALENQQTIANEMEAMQNQFVDYKTKSAEFRAIQEKTNRNWSTHKALQEKIMALDLDPELPPTFLSTMDYALTPEKPITTKLHLLVFGFAGGIALAMIPVAIQFLKGLPFTSQTQCQQKLGLHIAANITNLTKGKPTDEMIHELHHTSGFRDAMVALNKKDIVHITSATQSEATNLIKLSILSFLAKTNSKTLVISIKATNNPEAEPKIFGGLWHYEIGPDSFFEGGGTAKLLNQVAHGFDTILFDTTDLAIDSIKSEIAENCQHTNVIVLANGQTPRSRYRTFLSSLSIRDESKFSAMYVHETSSTTPLFNLKRTPNKHIGGELEPAYT